MKIIKIEKDGCMPCKQLQMMMDANDYKADEIINLSDEGADTIIDIYNIRGVPALLKVDDNGALLSSHIGVPDENTLHSFFTSYKE